MSKRTIRNLNAPFGKEFSDAFFSLVERHGREEVWRDFITMSACAISNSVDKRFYDEREKLYTQEETFRTVRFLESMMSLSKTEGEKKQNEDADLPTTKVSA